MRIQVDEIGEYCMEVQLLQQSIYKDSIRVQLAGAPYRGSIVTVVGEQTGCAQTRQEAVIDQNPDVKAWYEEIKEILDKKAAWLDKKRLKEKQHSTLEKLLCSLTRRTGAAASLIKLDDAEHECSNEGVPGLSSIVQQFSAELLKMGGELSEMNEVHDTLAIKIREHAGVPLQWKPDQAPSDQLDELRRTFCDPCCTPSRPYIRIHISVKHVSHGDFPMEIKGSVRYVTDDCYWHPCYDLQMRSGDLSKVETNYLALVTQNSNEDWVSVKIALHTGEPSAQGEPPELPPLVAGLKDNTQKVFVVCGNATGVAAPPQARDPKTMVHASGVADEGQAVFDLPGLLCIPSDNESHRFVITEQTFRSSMIFYCTPEISCDVFRASSWRNDSSFLYLAGPASVFWDGAMVMSTRFHTVNPGQTFHVFFGKEQLVELVVLPEKCLGVTEQTNAHVYDLDIIKRTIHVGNCRNHSLNIMAVFRLPCSIKSSVNMYVDPSIKTQSVAYDSDTEIAEDPVYENLDTAGDGALLWAVNKTTNHVTALAKVAALGTMTVSFSYIARTRRQPGKRLTIH